MQNHSMTLNQWITNLIIHPWWPVGWNHQGRECLKPATVEPFTIFVCIFATLTNLVRKTRTRSMAGARRRISHNISRKFVSLGPTGTTVLLARCRPWRLSFWQKDQSTCQTLSSPYQGHYTSNRTVHTVSTPFQRWISCVEWVWSPFRTLHWLSACLGRFLLQTLRNWARCKCTCASSVFPMLGEVTSLLPHTLIWLERCSWSSIQVSVGWSRRRSFWGFWTVRPCRSFSFLPGPLRRSLPLTHAPSRSLCTVRRVCWPFILARSSTQISWFPLLYRTHAAWSQTCWSRWSILNPWPQTQDRQ